MKPHPTIKRPFEPGIYVLTQDVTNPILDRRTRHDWRTTTPAFKKGQEFIIETSRYFEFSEEPKLPIAVDVLLKGSRWSHQTVTVWMTESEPRKEGPFSKFYHLGWALAPHLQRVGDIPKTVSKAAQIAELKADLDSALDLLSRFVERMRGHDDKGPAGEGWQSEELVKDIADADALLAEKGRK